MADLIKLKKGFTGGDYHYCEKKEINASFPFGHGLSYTGFKYGDRARLFPQVVKG